MIVSKVVAACFIVILIELSLTILSAVHRPTWVDGSPLDAVWHHIVWACGDVSLLTSLLILWMYSDTSLDFAFTVAIESLLLTYVMCQTGFTDVVLRKADRWVLRASNLIGFIVGITFLSTHVGHEDVMLYIYLVVIGTIVALIPSKRYGRSDGRAVQLCLIAGYPCLGVSNMEWALILLIVFTIVVACVLAIRHRSMKRLPMVPMMCAPFVATIIVSCEVTLPQLV